jgi:hypothetical protein
MRVVVLKKEVSVAEIVEVLVVAIISLREGNASSCL